MRTILVTGASGLVATELIHLLESSENSQIIAVSTHPDILKERYKDNNRVHCIFLHEIEYYKDVNIDAVIHCAFARSKDAGEIAKSLQFTSELLRITKAITPDIFVNISSQSVYGQSNPPLWTELTPPAPDYLYALGKFSTEEMTRMALEETGIKFTNIRLSSVSENARFLNVFVKNALMDLPINVQGGGQTCSFVDVRDVASGLMAVIKKAPLMESLAAVYNLGSGETRTIKELAEDTKRIIEGESCKKVEVNLTPADIKLEVGMDISLFCNTFDWKPQYGYDDMIRSLVALNGGGECPIHLKWFTRKEM